MVKKLKPETIEVVLPDEIVTICWKQIRSIVQEYHRQNMVLSNFGYEPHNKHKMTMEQLCVSCYMQGVNDGHQLENPS